MADGDSVVVNVKVAETPAPTEVVVPVFTSGPPTEASTGDMKFNREKMADAWPLSITAHYWGKAAPADKNWFVRDFLHYQTGNGIDQDATAQLIAKHAHEVEALKADHTHEIETIHNAYRQEVEMVRIELKNTKVVLGQVQKALHDRVVARLATKFAAAGDDRPTSGEVTMAALGDPPKKVDRAKMPVFTEAEIRMLRKALHPDGKSDDLKVMFEDATKLFNDRAGMLVKASKRR
jgi:hypothetical protein